MVGLQQPTTYQHLTDVFGAVTYEHRPVDHCSCFQVLVLLYFTDHAEQAAIILILNCPKDRILGDLGSSSLGFCLLIQVVLSELLIVSKTLMGNNHLLEATLLRYVALLLDLGQSSVHKVSLTLCIVLLWLLELLRLDSLQLQLSMRHEGGTTFDWARRTGILARSIPMD